MSINLRGYFQPDYSLDGAMIVFNQFIPNQSNAVLTMESNGSSAKVINSNGEAATGLGPHEAIAPTTGGS